jgi:hypothetical protein
MTSQPNELTAFTSPHMLWAFTDNDQARAEVGADQWYIILYDAGVYAIVGTETGALIKLTLTGVNYRLSIADEFVMPFSIKVEVLHRLKEAQRARAYRLKRANAKLRKSLLAQMKSLRAVRRRYDALAESDLIQLSRSFQ